MPTIEVAVEVAATPEQIDAVLRNAELAPAWTAGLEKLELVEGEPGEPGSVGHAHYVEGGRKYVLEDRLEEAVPGALYRSRITGDGIDAIVETRLTSVGPGSTLLSLEWTGSAPTLLGRLILAALRFRIRSRALQDLESLKSLCEAR